MSYDLDELERLYKVWSESPDDWHKAFKRRELFIVLFDAAPAMFADLRKMREGIQDMADIMADYDGYTTADELKTLIDDLRDFASRLLEGKEAHDD